MPSLELSLKLWSSFKLSSEYCKPKLFCLYKINNVLYSAYSLPYSRPHLKRDGSKSTWRKIWEWIHRIWGLSVISIGLVQVTLGVFLLIPPVPVWAIWITMLILWVIAFIVIETIKCIHQYRKPSAGGKEPLESDEFELKYKHP